MIQGFEEDGQIESMYVYGGSDCGVQRNLGKGYKFFYSGKSVVPEHKI